jgi:long-subunit acyl-CoA synthetase (AMP-forming)
MNWAERLKGQPVPVVSFLDGETEEYLSAANLYMLIREQLKTWRRQGIKPLDTIGLVPNGKEFLVQLLTAHSADQTAVLHASSGAPPSELPRKQVPGVWFQSSGTEQARWVFLPWTSIDAQVQAHGQLLSHFEQTVRISVLPKQHVFGLVIDLLVGLYLRQTIFLSFQSFSSTVWRKALQQVDASDQALVCLTPRLLHLVLKDPSHASLLKQLHVVIGGATTPDWMMQEARRKLGSLHEGYGLTEAGPGVLWNGKVLPFVRCRLQPVIEQGKETEWNELLVHSSTLGQFESQPEDWVGEYYRTRDLAEIDDKQNFKIVGRITERVKTQAGQWTSFSQVERELEKCFALDWVLVSTQGAEIVITIGPQEDRKLHQILNHLEKRLGPNTRLKILRRISQLEAARTKDVRLAANMNGEEYATTAS